MKYIIIWWLEPLIDYLWENKKRILDQAKKEDYLSFDYPDYAGLPTKVSNALWSEHVDILQEELWGHLKNSRTKESFAKSICKCLTRDTIRISNT